MLLGVGPDGPVRGRRVAVTGLGAVTCCGLGVEALWEGLVHPTISGDRRVTDFDAADYFGPKEARRVDRFAYNSTFITGNLRDVAEGLYDALTPNSAPEIREKGLSQARHLSLICLFFLAGAIFGAWAAPRFGNHSLWLAEPALLAVAFHLLRNRLSLTSTKPAQSR